MQKRMLKLFVSLSIIIFFIGFTSALTCSVMSATDCTDNGWNIVMRLSSATNAHAEISGTYPQVLCCDETKSTTCSTDNHLFYGAGVPSNKITGLSSLTNAHAQRTEDTTYTNNVCYEDLECISTTSTCPVTNPNPSNNYPMELLDLSSATNAHVGTGYSTKICCKDSSARSLCLLSSASWEKTDAFNGEEINMNVGGTNCAGATITFEIYEDDIVSGDDAITTRTGTYSSGSWDATWMDDDEIVVSQNKYYFIASVGSSTVKSDILSVSQQDIENWCIENSITQCSDYDETQCSDNPCPNVVPSCPSLQSGDTCTCAWSPSENICMDAVISVTSSYCGDSNVDKPNSIGTNEQCDPDIGTSVFLDAENTCQEVNSIFTGGTLECQTSCIFDTINCVNPNPSICGDNIINVFGEHCDGTNLGIYSNCQAFGYDGGTLECSNCKYDLTGCTDPTSNFCGNGIVDTPNSGNMNEQCDTTLPATKNTCSKINSIYVDTGGIPSCSTCLIDISGCALATGQTASCGDEIINQLTEECDTTSDLFGLTCGYLGFAVGDGLGCSDTCILDTQGCIVDTSRTSDSCLIHTIDTDPDGCDDGFLMYDWWGEWTGDEADRPEDCPAEIAPKSEVAPCIAQAQLPFFGIYQFIIAFALILGIYFLVGKIRKKR